MTGFVLGVAGSIMATALTVFGGWIFSRRARWWILSLLSRVGGLGSIRVHRHQSDANHELAQEIGRARWIRVMVGRGNELTRDGFRPLWTGVGRAPIPIRVLLPDPCPDSALPPADDARESWLSRRERELVDSDPGYGSGVLTEQVLANYHYLREAARNGAETQIRFYDLPHLYRVIATDRLAFITLYEESTHGRNSPCIVVRRPGKLYEFALRVLNTAWDGARTPEPTIDQRSSTSRDT